MLPLEEQVSEIEKYQELKLKALELRGMAFKAISVPYSPGRPGWNDPGDKVEGALLFRILHSNQRALGGVNDYFDSRSDDAVPIFRSAILLQACAAAPGQALSPHALDALAQIVNEISEASPPTWMGGALSAGKGALPTAFVSGECGRALLALDAAFLNTGEVIDTIHRASPYFQAFPGLKAWHRLHIVCRSEALRATLNELASKSAFTIPDSGAVIDINKLAKDTIESIERSVTSASTFSAALNGEGKKCIEELLRILRNGIKAATDRIDGFPVLAESLRTAAQVIRDRTLPIERFVSAVIDRELAAESPHLDRPVDAAELVFAAAIFARIAEGGSDHPKVAAALRVVRKLLSADGRVLSLRPFDVLEKGYRLYVHPLEVTLRLSELLTLVGEEPDYAFVQKMLRPFFDTRAKSVDGREPGWAADPAGPARSSEWWTTALAVDALDSVVTMLDSLINRKILPSFSVRHPAELKRSLDSLFYPDFGISADQPIALKLLKIRTHTSRGPRPERPLFSMVLYGPPGTGKTTLAEALAKSANVPLVGVTPSDILIGGEEKVERRAKAVFSALSMLTHVVILFDEFDSILQARDEDKEPPSNIFRFLAPGMLPKLKKLHDSAEVNRTSYILATNYLNRLDRAAMRDGRFDDRHGIYPPDLVSRVGRLQSEFFHEHKTLPDFERTLNVLRQTGRAPMGRIARPGWFTGVPKGREEPGTVFHYLLCGGADIPAVPAEAEFRPNWKNLFGDELNQTEVELYWSAWETIEKWEEALQKSGVPTTWNWDVLVRSWRGV